MCYVAVRVELRLAQQRSATARLSCRAICIPPAYLARGARHAIQDVTKILRPREETITYWLSSRLQTTIRRTQYKTHTYSNLLKCYSLYCRRVTEPRPGVLGWRVLPWPAPRRRHLLRHRRPEVPLLV